MAELVYLDESGSVGKGAKKQRYLILVAVVVDEVVVQSLSTRMGDLAMTHLGWNPADFEFHGQELWAGTGYWKDKSYEECLAAFEAVIALLAEFDISVVHATIDKEALHERYDGNNDSNAYLLALQFLLEKLDRWPRAVDRQLRILIADETKQEQLKAIEMVADMQKWGVGLTPGNFQHDPLRSIIDSMHFVDSKHSPGVQLADMVAFVHHRRRLGDQHHPNANEAVARMATAIWDATHTWRQTWPTNSSTQL